MHELAALDLNLLVTFFAIDEHRHVGRAARALGLSQPALSHALARLRAAFDDELFIKTPRGVVPTARAQSLSAPIRQICSDIQTALLGQPTFATHTIDRTFRIQTTDLIECLLAAPLTNQLAVQAPNARLAFEALRFELPKPALESGRTDLAIAGFFEPPPEGYIRQLLFRDGFLGCVAKRHPLARGRVTLARYAQAEHVLIAPGGELQGVVDRLLAKQKRRRRVVLGSSGFLASGFAVAETNTVLTAPARLVKQLCQILPLKSFTLPLAVPPIAVYQVWHQRNQDAPEHRFLRQLVHAVMSR